jgi:hypothetical protein
MPSAPGSVAADVMNDGCDVSSSRSRVKESAEAERCWLSRRSLLRLPAPSAAAPS